MLQVGFPRSCAFIPGKAQDVRAYLPYSAVLARAARTRQHRQHGPASWSNRYADGPVTVRLRKDTLQAGRRRVDYPDDRPLPPGPRQAGSPSGSLESLPPCQPMRLRGHRRRPGDAVIRACPATPPTTTAMIRALEEQRSDALLPAFASGLDAPSGDRVLLHARKGTCTVDAVLSLTGFSLVGGPGV